MVSGTMKGIDIFVFVYPSGKYGERPTGGKIQDSDQNHQFSANFTQQGLICIYVASYVGTFV